MHSEDFGLAQKHTPRNKLLPDNDQSCVLTKASAPSVPA